MIALKKQKDVQIPMRDGGVLVADIFEPDEPGEYPVILSVGPYGKDIPFHTFNATCYAKSPWKSPYMVWETVDPSWWVPRGYVVVRTDMRGMHKSRGRIDLHGQREMNDYCDAINWSGTQSWSNGKVGLCGVSYFAFTQWQVAAQQPEHLAAIIPWEGFSDFYREEQRHGGIFCNGFVSDRWYALRIIRGQHGKGTVGEPLLSSEELAENRAFELPDEIRARELIDEFYQGMTADLSKVKVPVYSSGNWGGMGLHGRGCIQGYLGVSSEHKWLEMHNNNFVESFYGEEGLQTQLRFLDYWLKGVDNGLLDTPPIKLAIRRGGGNGFTWRFENEWPLARTQWTRVYLDAAKHRLGDTAPEVGSSTSFGGATGSVEFRTEPFKTDTELTGPLMAKLWVSSSTSDMDIFIDIRQYGADGKPVQVETTYLMNGPVTKGWLRVSHRKLDDNRSLPYQPVHTHDQLQKLVPGDVVPVEVEIWPTSMVFEKGCTLALSISCCDGDAPGQFYHNDPVDRPDAVFLVGTYSVFAGGQYESYLLLPIIPTR